MWGDRPLTASGLFFCEVALSRPLAFLQVGTLELQAQLESRKKGMADGRSASLGPHRPAAHDNREGEEGTGDGAQGSSYQLAYATLRQPPPPSMGMEDWASKHLNTRKACSVAASPSPTCCHGTADPSRSPCWSPATALSEKRPVKCSNWCRPTWGTGRHVWTGATAPSSLLPSAGTYRACGMSCMSSWWGKRRAMPAPGAWQLAGSWWLSAWLSLLPRPSSAVTWRATSRDTRSPPVTRNVSFTLAYLSLSSQFFMY